MKIEYMRNLQFGYMRITVKESLGKIEEEMLTYNRIEGLLPVHWQKEDGDSLFRYDITGKLALDTVLETRKADEKLLRQLLTSLCAVIAAMEKYLLSPGYILLKPETVFWDAQRESMSFCYCPQEGNLQKRLCELMEYMLAKTDHKNVLAVQLAYGVYEELQKEDFCLEVIQKYLQEPEPRNNPVIEEEEPEVFMEERVAEKIWEKGLMWIKRKLERKPVHQAELLVERDGEDFEEELPTTLLKAPAQEIEGVLRYEGKSALPDLEVNKFPYLIGSAGDCDGIIRHPTISRHHAKITYLDGTYFLEDLNSTNGTKAMDGLLSYKTRVSIRKNEKICFANEPYRFL